MKASILLFLALGACGPKRAAAVTPSFTAVGAERAALEELQQDLLGRSDDASHFASAAELAQALAHGAADAAVREAAVALLAQLRDDVPTPVPAPVCPEPAITVVAPPVTDPRGVEADTRAVMRSADDRLARAREALRAGDYLGAVDALEPLRDTPAWRDAAPFWEEAVDGWVGQERERVGALFVKSRSMPREERRATLLEVRDALAELADRFPDSVWREPILQNLERVERELEGSD